MAQNMSRLIKFPRKSSFHDRTEKFLLWMLSYFWNCFLEALTKYL